MSFNNHLLIYVLYNHENETLITAGRYQQQSEKNGHNICSLKQ